MVVSQRRVPPGVLFTAQTPFKHVLQGQTQPHENSRGGTGASPDDLLAAPHRWTLSSPMIDEELNC